MRDRKKKQASDRAWYWRHKEEIAKRRKPRGFEGAPPEILELKTLQVAIARELRKTPEDVYRQTLARNKKSWWKHREKRLADAREKYSIKIKQRKAFNEQRA